MNKCTSKQRQAGLPFRPSRSFAMTSINLPDDLIRRREPISASDRNPDGVRTRRCTHTGTDVGAAAGLLSVLSIAATLSSLALSPFLPASPPLPPPPSPSRPPSSRLSSTPFTGIRSSGSAPLLKLPIELPCGAFADIVFLTPCSLVPPNLAGTCPRSLRSIRSLAVSSSSGPRRWEKDPREEEDFL